MSKLVIIGAGSTVFVKSLVGDLLLLGNLKLDTVSLVDIDSKKLEIIQKLINKVKDQIGGSIKIEVTTDRKKVLAGAAEMAEDDNLPRNSCIEIPCLAGKDGIRPLKIGKLPEQCATLNRSNIGVQILAAKACLEPDEDKKKELVKMAIKLDPLTSVTLTLDKIDDMVEELFKLKLLKNLNV